MTDLVYDYISMGVDMILAAAILSAIVVLLRSSVVLSSYQANIAANSDRINYYKQFNMYDCTDTLCSADIMSALIYYRYDLKIVIDLGSNKILYNEPKTGKFLLSEMVGGGTSVRELGVSDLSTELLANFTYRSYLCENGVDAPTREPYSGGLITGIKFEKK